MDAVAEEALGVIEVVTEAVSVAEEAVEGVDEVMEVASPVTGTVTIAAI